MAPSVCGFACRSLLVTSMMPSTVALAQQLVRVFFKSSSSSFRDGVSVEFAC